MGESGRLRGGAEEQRGKPLCGCACAHTWASTLCCWRRKLSRPREGGQDLEVGDRVVTVNFTSHAIRVQMNTRENIRTVPQL